MQKYTAVIITMLSDPCSASMLSWQPGLQVTAAQQAQQEASSVLQDAFDGAFCVHLMLLSQA